MAAYGPIVQNVNQIVESFGSMQLSPMDNRMLIDAIKRISNLYQQMETGKLTDQTSQNLSALVAALAAKDHIEAGKIHVELIQKSWAEARAWLPGFKNLITLVKNSN